MQVAIEDQGDLKRKLTITIPQNQVKAAYDKVYSSLKGQVKVKGFRPGKMPQQLMEKRFKKYMSEEAMETLVPEYYQKAIEQENLTPAIQPHFDDLRIDKKKPLTFTATVEVWPEVQLPDFSKFTLEKKEVKITEEELKAQQNQHLEKYATYEPKESAAEEGDRILLSFEAHTEDNQDVSQPNHFYILGSKQFIPEFEEALQGLKAGEEKEFDALLPADHPREEYRSKKTHFKVTAQGVDTRILPEVDETFLKNFSGRAATPEEFTEMVKKEVTEIKEQKIAADYRTELRKQLNEILDFPVPESLLEQETEHFKQDLTQQKKTDNLEENAKAEALSQLRLGRFIYLMQEKEKIEIDPNNIYNRFMLNAQMLGLNPSELIQSDHGRRFYEDTRHMVTEEAILDHIANKVLNP